MAKTTGDVVPVMLPRSVAATNTGYGLDHNRIRLMPREKTHHPYSPILAGEASKEPDVGTTPLPAN